MARAVFEIPDEIMVKELAERLAGHELVTLKKKLDAERGRHEQDQEELLDLQIDYFRNHRYERDWRRHWLCVFANTVLATTLEAINKGNRAVEQKSVVIHEAIAYGREMLSSIEDEIAVMENDAYDSLEAAEDTDVE